MWLSLTEDQLATLRGAIAHAVATTGLTAEDAEQILEQMNKPQPRLAWIEAARDEYARGSSDNIEIDDSSACSISDNGVWIQAWVRLDNEAVKQAEKDYQ